MVICAGEHTIGPTRGSVDLLYGERDMDKTAKAMVVFPRGRADVVRESEAEVLNVLKC